MKPSAIALSLAVMLSIADSSDAQQVCGTIAPVILSIGGDDQWATGANGLGVGWAFSRRVRNVTVSARLMNGGGYAGGRAYLVSRIGLGTTPADEIASTQFELPVGFKGLVQLFTNLDLAPGNYWLVFASPREGPFSYLNWITSSPIVLNGIPESRYLGTTVASPSGITDYAPASVFGRIVNGVGYQIEITGDLGQPPDRPVRRIP